MTPDNWNNILLLLAIIGAILFLIFWDWFLNKQFDDMEKPIAVERKDLNRKIRI